MDTTEENILATPADYASLVAAFIARRHELGLSQVEVDEIAGMSGGYCAKIEAGMKRFGPVSLPCMLGALGLELTLTRTTPHHIKQRRLG